MVIDELIAMDRKSPKRICVFGDAMTDVYVHGEFGTCQEECYKFVEHSRVECPGGAANAANQLSRWNVKAHKYYVKDDCQSVKTRHLVNGKFVFRHDKDNIPPTGIVQLYEMGVLDLLSFEDVSSVLISDYDKGMLSPEFIQRIIKAANERGIPVVADAKREPSVYRGAILKCNIEYAKKFDVNPLDTPSYVITHGEKTPAIWDSGRMIERHPQSPPVQCANPVGAGDCFAAHLTLALAHGISLERAACIAHSAGRVYVQHPHNRAPWPYEIRKDMDPVRGKIISDLNALRESIKGNVVWANGCFDLFGPHHLYYLEQAKAQGDVLVVGVNSDESVSSLKGASRPVIPQEQRASLIAGLACVDWVTVFDGSAPVAALADLRPDVRVCAQMPNRNQAGDEYAKEVRLIPKMEGWSTTNLLASIRDRSCR